MAAEARWNVINARADIEQPRVSFLRYQRHSLDGLALVQDFSNLAFLCS